MTTSLSAIDLFSGCGGLTLGLRFAGFEVIGAIESDDLAVETYSRNHPHVRIWNRDIRTVSVTEVKRALQLERGQLDLLAGCPPCQGFSTLTTMNGRVLKRDPRNTLVYEFLRFVRGLRPRAVMLENVPGLQKRSMFRVLVSELRRLRYNVKYEILNASDYGVPQHRRRLVLIGSRVGEVSFAQKSSAKKTVRWAFRDLHNFIHGDELHRLPQERTARVAEIIKSVPQDGGSRRSLHGRLRLACHDRFDGFHDVYGRMSWDRPSPTITGGCCNPSKGRFLHPVKNRCISLREAAVLQSFPPTYYFSTARGKFATAQMIGNALPPEFIRRHAHALIEILRTNDDRREQ